VYFKFKNSHQIDEIFSSLDNIFRQQTNQREILNTLKIESCIGTGITWALMTAEVISHSVIFSVTILPSVLGTFLGTLIISNYYLQVSTLALITELIFERINRTIKVR